MIYSTIGSTPLRVSKAAIGAMSFGAKLDERAAAEVLALAADNGVTMIDTANWYNGGESERILGRILTPAYRDNFVIASKVAYRLRDGKTVTDLSREFIMSAVEESLQRMKIDHMDICYFHAPDYSTPLDESLEAMDRLVQDGKVGYFGVSNYAAWQIMDMGWRAKTAGFAAPVVTQNVYNLLSRGLDAELKPCLKEMNMGLVVFNPLAGGLLSGLHHGGTPAEGSRFAGSAMYFDRYWNDENFRAISLYEDIAARAGMSLLELALRWCLSQSHVTSVLLGMSRPSQFEQNVAIAHKGELDSQLLKKCDEVWKQLHSHDVNYNR